MTWMIEFVEMYITMPFRNLLHVFRKVEKSEQDEKT